MRCVQAARALACDLLLASMPDRRLALLSLATAASCWLHALQPLLAGALTAGANGLQQVVQAAARDCVADNKHAPGACLPELQLACHTSGGLCASALSHA